MNEISKNILLISGSGRNIGKTSFIRKVIECNASQKPVAVKITPHFHEPTSGLLSISDTPNYRIFQEANRTSGKDSSLFLEAGAWKVFYIQAPDIYLKETFSLLVPQLLPDQPIVIESAALRKFIEPGLYLFIQKEDQEVKPSALEMRKLADCLVFSDGVQFSRNPESITFNKIWEVHDNA